MLPILLDAAGFQKAANISSPQFLNAMMQGLIPPAVGLWNGQALWPTDVAVKAGEALAPLIESGVFPSAEPEAIAPVAAAIAAPVEPEKPKEFHAQDGDWPDEMTQVMAESYLQVGANWLDKQQRAGIISARRDGRFKLFTRADLDALAQLPVYRYRKRKGFRGGVSTAEWQAQQARKFREPVNEKVFGDKAASEYLGIGYGILALTRKDGSGPAWFNDNGVPKYRKQDLDVFKEKMDKEALPRYAAQAQHTVIPPAQAKLLQGYVAKAPAMETDKTAPTRPMYAPGTLLTKEQAAQWLGVKPKSMENWKMRGTGPANEKNEAGKTVWRIEALQAFERDHRSSLEHSRRMCGFYDANPDKVPVLIRQRKAGVANGPRDPSARKTSKRPTAKPKNSPLRKGNAVNQKGARVRH